VPRATHKKTGARAAGKRRPAKDSKQELLMEPDG